MTSFIQPIGWRGIAIVVAVAGVAFVAGRHSATIAGIEKAELVAGRDAALGLTVDSTKGSSARDASSGSVAQTATSAPTPGDLPSLSAAADKAQHLPSAAARRLEIQRLYRTFAATNVDEALAHASTLSDGFAQRVALLTIFDHISATDPERALLSLSAVPNQSLHRELEQVALRAMALQDPIGALRRSAGLKGEPSVYRNLVMREWATYAPADAMDYAVQSTDPSFRTYGIFAVVNRWLGHDSDQALDWITSNLRSVPEDDQLMLAMTVVTNAPDRISELEAHLPPSIMREVRSNLATNLARSDPQGAATLLETTTDRRERRSMIRGIATGFAGKNSLQGVDWLNTLQGPERAVAQLTLYGKWLQTDLEGAMAQIDALPDSERSSLSSTVISSLVQHEPERAFDWMLQQPPGVMTDMNVYQLALTWAQTNPLDAVRTFVEHQDENWAAQAVQASFHALALSDLPAAREWTTQLTNPGAQHAAAGTVAQNGIVDDREATLKWIDTLTPRLRDSALASAARNPLLRTEEAYNLAQRIQTEAERRSAMEYVVMQLASTNPTEAVDWAQRSGLSDNFIARIKQITNSP